MLGHDVARHCLIIANQDYQDPAFDELPGASEDATSLSEVLANPEIGDFEVAVVRNAPSVLFRRSIEAFFQRADRDDLLWLHMSCHGMKNRQNRLFLVAADTEKEFLVSTGIDCTFISDQVEGSRSGQVVVFLDCCYSGAYSRGLRTRSQQDLVDVAEAFGGRGRVVITASNALQFSHESTITSRKAVEPSIFTKAIVTVSARVKLISTVTGESAWTSFMITCTSKSVTDCLIRRPPSVCRAQREHYS
jgi:molecular chaperone DnaK